MGISSKTRKILWARSGNKCAICRKELITNKNEAKATVVGEECHIISKKDDGPRGNSKAQIEHDEFDNLVLLCLEHHKIIDENEEDYSVSRLKDIKRKHEAWVSDKFKKEKQELPFILPRIESGQEIAKILSKVHLYYFNNENFENDEQAIIVADFFQNLQDWGNILPDFDAGEIIKTGQQLQKELDSLKRSGFLLFGGVSKKNFKTLGKTDVVTFSIYKESSPNVIKLEEILDKLKKTDA